MGRFVTLETITASVVAGYNAGTPYQTLTKSEGSSSATVDASPTNIEILDALYELKENPSKSVGLSGDTGPLVIKFTKPAMPDADEVIYAVRVNAYWFHPGDWSGIAFYNNTATVYAAVGLGAPTDGRDPAWELAGTSVVLPNNGPGDGLLGSAVEQAVSPVTQIDADEVHVWLQHTGPNMRWANFVSATVRIADKPTVVATAPAATVTDTSNPTITWTPTLDDVIGGQTNYDVRIFDSATHGDALFDVDTSVPYASTGVASGSATSWESTALVNDTYFAYVRVAQTTNGEQVWSAWDSISWIQDVDGPEWSSVFRSDSPPWVGVSAIHDQVSPDWVRTEFERSTDSGVTWTHVGEVISGLETTNPAQITDLWYQPGASTIWRARGWNGPAAGDWASSTALVPDPTATGYVTAPNGDRVPIRPTSRAFQRARRVGTHHVLGRGAPVGTSDVLRFRTGTWTLETWTAAEADALEAILEANPVVHIALHVDLDVAPGWWQIASADDTMTSPVANAHYRLWTLQATEVAPPEGH